MRRLLGIDLGGTAAKLGVCDERGRAIDSVTIPTPARPDPEATAADIAAAARRLRGFSRCVACGLGAPGPLDSARRMVLVTPNLGWSRVPLPLLMRRALGMPVSLENDANCAAVAEWAAGAGRRARSVALYTLGTGVGGGLVLDGKLWIGSRGGAAEFGHIRIEPRGRRCGCGQRGCLETLASASAVARGARAPDAEAAFARARNGDARAARAIARAAAALGIAIAGLYNTLQPERIVLAGGMAAGPGFVETVRHAARKSVFRIYAKHVKVVRGTLGLHAGWIGAAFVAASRMRTVDRRS
ncbi:MAG: ROK family protein [Planctomycetes bacterium]|nr:ROK family protein [Planctomycetota bacterium]